MKKEQEDLVLNNMGLAYDIAFKYKDRVRMVYELEDAQQVCLEGLITAVNSFDETRGVNFSTYAYTVIKHHLLVQSIGEMKKRHNAGVVAINSIYEPILDGEDITLLDSIEDPFNLEGEYINNEEVIRLYKYINELESPYKEIILLRLKDLTYKQIADILDLEINTTLMYYKKSINMLRYKFKVGRDEDER